VKIKNLLLAMCVSISIVGFTGCGKSMVNTYKLKVASSPVLCEAPIHIAIEKGFFAQEGLDFEVITMDTSAKTDGVAANTIDAGFGMTGKFVAPLTNELPLKVTAGMHTGCIQTLTKAGSGINSIADLKGKKVGVASLVDAQIIATKRALAYNNVKESDVEFLVFPAADLPNALENSAIDAYTHSDPATAIAIQDKGFKAILTTATDEHFKDEYCCISFVTTKLAEEHPEVAKKFVAATNKASQWIQDNPEEAAKIQIEKKYVTGSAELNGSVLKTYNYKPSIQGGYDALKTAIQAMVDLKIIKSNVNARELADKSFVNFE
jgi:NitT/TauT family transport system substrate-binding protein